MNRKQILDYCLELENVKESELPDEDNDKIIQFNNTLSDKYGLYGIYVLENDNLYFKGRITSSTKSENNVKLKLLIAELNEFYKQYKLKRVIKSLIAYGHTIWMKGGQAMTTEQKGGQAMTTEQKGICNF